MSSLTFKALIDAVHFDPKKGVVKIQLVATSYVSMDKLTTLGPSDESIKVILESAQTKIASFPLVPEAEAALEEGGKWVKKAADVLNSNEVVDGEEDEEQIITEFPLSKAEGDVDEDEVEGRGDGLI